MAGVLAVMPHEDVRGVPSSSRCLSRVWLRASVLANSVKLTKVFKVSGFEPVKGFERPSHGAVWQRVARLVV